MPIDPKELVRHRIDYQAIGGKPSKEFVCPITLQHGGELMDGHIIPQAVKQAARHTVIQRKDVDQHFGHTVEPDMIDMVNIPAAKTFGQFLELTDKDKRFGIGPNGERWHLFRAAGDPDRVPFPKVELLDKAGKAFDSFHVKAKPGELAGMTDIVVDGTVTMFHPAIIAGFLKAAYLTMFRMIGYRCMVGPTGDYVRRHLANFARHGRTKEDAIEIFKRFRGSCRLLFTEQGADLPDSVTRNFSLLNYHHGVLFSYTLLFRLNGWMYTVTLPADMDNPVAALANYHRWLADPTMEVDSRYCTFTGRQWDVGQAIQIGHKTTPPPGFRPGGEKLLGGDGITIEKI